MTGQHIPVAEVTRGEFVESMHHAAAAVVDRHGDLIAQVGSANLVTYSRSSLKPFQALPTVRRGFPDRFGLTDRHLALVCGSHSGEERHIKTGREIQRVLGVTDDALQCGAHIPLLYNYSDGPTPAKQSFSPLYNNCSGKHLGMLALAKILGCPPSEYLDFNSPVQRLIKEHVIEMLGLDPNGLRVAIDGCSAPNYAVPLRSLAHGFARLVSAVGPEPVVDGDLREACARIVTAMRTHPEMVSGEKRFDLDLALATKGRVFSKAGGEAMECIGVPERGWGIAVKIIDGNPRAVGPVVTWLLDELGLLSDNARRALDQYLNPVLRNHRGLVIGTIRMIGQLERLKT